MKSHPAHQHPEERPKHVAEAFRPPKSTTMPEAFRRKRNRLPLKIYQGTNVYSLTLACADRKRNLAQRQLAESCIEVLRFCSQRHRFSVLAYCFMPDHVHLLVEGSDRSDLPRFIKDFKQRTGFAYRRVSPEPLWQKSYYDHVLRSEEDTREVARYIINNPVRAGIVASAADYPHSGSFTCGRAIMEA